ncbi:MAG: hypothetical protein L6Q99_08225 [Planctomycetes bacterium]|nr:hypothetical protein [Planctomycetota bacterium]
MLPSTKVTLVGCAAAAGLGAWLGGSYDAAVGRGVIGGFVAGAAVALASGLVQKRITRQKPALLVHVLGGGFVVKIFALLALTLAVRFLAPLAESFEWRAFVLAFAAAVLVLLPCTAWELLRLTQSSAPTRNSAVAYQQGTPS